MADRTGQQIGNYRLLKLLGRGSFAEVYLAEHVHHVSRQVALKLLYGDQPGREEVERFRKEAQITARFNHPNILRVLDSGLEAGVPYLATEYAPQGSLHRRFKHGTPVALSTLLPYIQQIASALQYIHDQHIIHRGLSPASILVDQNNQALLSGFAIAIEEQDSLAQKDRGFIGIPAYAAPEQFAGGKVFPASDQYALAVMIYEWLTGENPFQGTFTEIAFWKTQRNPPSLRSKVPAIPAAVEEVVLIALAKDPKDRFASVRAFANALEQASQLANKQKRTARAGQIFGTYRLIRRLSDPQESFTFDMFWFDSASQGESYLAEHLVDKTTAMVLLPSGGELSPDKQQHLLREAEFMARLKHPNLLSILDFGVQNSTPFVVIPSLPNGTLRDRFPKGVRFSPEAILPSVKQVAAGLQFAHDQRIVHRDIKPTNIFVNEQQQALIGDFSIAIVLEAGQAFREVEGFAGTPAYAAPEQLQGRPTLASDQYALGVMVYEWLAGGVPFESGNYLKIALQKEEHSPPPLRDKRPDLSPAVEGVVLTALEKQPEYRFPSVTAFAGALEKAIFPRQKQKGTDLSGKQLKNYKLIRLIGQGNFGAVYLGEHVRLGMQTAIKVLHERPSDEEVQKFLAEARILSTLDHPHILRVLEFDEEDDLPFLVTGYAPNGTLRDRHPKGVRLPLPTIVAYAKQAANALQHAHDARLIHLDIKPENLLLGKRREVLVGDFGISVILQQSKSHQTVRGFSGTPIYAAPEQFEQRPGIASDQYALGTVAYEWLTGGWPFQGESWAIGTQKLTKLPPPLRSKVPGISPAVEQVVLRALAKDPKDRFPSIQAFAAAMEEAL